MKYPRRYASHKDISVSPIPSSTVMDRFRCERSHRFLERHGSAHDSSGTCSCGGSPGLSTTCARIPCSNWQWAMTALGILSLGMETAMEGFSICLANSASKLMPAPGVRGLASQESRDVSEDSPNNSNMRAFLHLGLVTCLILNCGWRFKLLPGRITAH